MPQIYMIFFQTQALRTKKLHCSNIFYLLLDSWFNKNPYLRRNFQPD